MNVIFSRGFPNVAWPIVESVTIYVVDLALRPLTMHKEPRYAMGVVALAVDTHHLVPTVALNPPCSRTYSHIRRRAY